ncbi:hypothetical protein OG612_45570 (plasmid) [Streptomyces sp. NBC_01527]|uniref:hypothetical protein n=1 Tax=Streptomyces sp. NBC_01527 TaxID=2903894 RepID=UPI002F91A12C
MTAALIEQEATAPGTPAREGDGGGCGVSGLDGLSYEERVRLAAPWPVRWLEPWVEGEPKRMVELFGGPGGMGKGRDLLGVPVDCVAVEKNEGAAATARAAGHQVIVADIRTLDPMHPALAYTHWVHGSPPCGTLSKGGKLTGIRPDDVMHVADVIGHMGEVFGFLQVDDVCSLYGGPHDWAGEVIEGMEDHPDADKGGPDCWGGILPPNGTTPDELRAWALEGVSDERTALMIEPVMWVLALQSIGAPVEGMTMEQSDNLLRKAPRICEEIQAELWGAGWQQCVFQIEDAADFGAPTHRVRTYAMATRNDAPLGYSYDVDRRDRPEFKEAREDGGWLEIGHYVDLYRGRTPLPTVTLAQAMDWAPGHIVDTRGQRRIDPKTGRVKGGGSFPADRVGQCVTATWYGATLRATGERAFTQSDLGMIVGFPRDHPWRHVGKREGIRTRAQQAADAVCPLIGAGIAGAVLGADWYQPAKTYHAQLYRLDREDQQPPVTERPALNAAPLRAELPPAALPVPQAAVEVWHPLAAAPAELIAWH